MQLSLTARAIFSGARGSGGREGGGDGGDGRGKAAAREGRRTGASCISHELGCNNYYLSRPFPPSLSPSLPLAAIILVRATPRPSAETVFQRAVADAAVAAVLRQIELISGIYRTADFPFVLSRTTEYTSVGISLSYAACTRTRAAYD